MAWHVPSPIARLARRACVFLPLTLTGCPGMMGTPQRDPEKDQAATAAHFEESAQAYYEGGRYQQAVLMWRKALELEPEQQKAKWGLAKSLAMVGTPPALREAESIYAQIVNLDWTHPTLGDRSHDVAKDYAEVFSQLADFYDRDIQSLTRRLEEPAADQAALRQQIAQQTQRRNGLLQQAIPLYQQVLQNSPNNPYAIGGLAKSYLMLGQDQQGIQYARRYVGISVRSQDDWSRELAAFEKEHQAELTKEQKKWFQDKVTSAREKELKIRLLLGTVLYRTRDYRGAIAEYTRILELDAVQPAAFLERAQAKAAISDYRGAMADLETYLKVTDPVEMRQARIDAAQLMDQYRLKAAAQPMAAPPAPASGYPPPAPAPRAGPAVPPPPPPPAPLPAPRPTGR